MVGTSRRLQELELLEQHVASWISCCLMRQTNNTDQFTLCCHLTLP